MLEREKFEELMKDVVELMFTLKSSLPPKYYAKVCKEMNMTYDSILLDYATVDFR